VFSLYDNLAKGMPALKKAWAGATAALTAAKAAKGVKAKSAALGVTTLKVAKTMGVAAIPIAAGLAAVIGTGRALGAFADGGFPSTGQVFLAREAGPELVGTLNGRTAVVNNDQIVESISQAVYAANVDLEGVMRQVLRAIQEKNTNISIDGRKLTDHIDRVRQERGLDLIGSGASFRF
jgi:hypothetical protein